MAERKSLKILGSLGLAAMALNACTDKNAVGGMWTEPTPPDKSVITTNTITLAAHAYPISPKFPPVTEVKFTGYWSGAVSPDPNKPDAWPILCEETLPDHGDVYVCEVDLDKLNIPPGQEFSVSFDVYNDRVVNYSPHGTKTYIYQNNE